MRPSLSVGVLLFDADQALDGGPEMLGELISRHTFQSGPCFFCGRLKIGNEFHCVPEAAIQPQVFAVFEFSCFVPDGPQDFAPLVFGEFDDALPCLWAVWR